MKGNVPERLKVVDGRYYTRRDAQVDDPRHVGLTARVQPVPVSDVSDELIRRIATEEMVDGANAYVAAIRPFKLAGVEYAEVILLYLKK
ncbi:hypothetical protein HYV81_01140 [Candidatus Woesearchaeota archaeon]|nr:hypothetical protein [Candidatus Woesearchaeota archaeon]